MNTMLLSPRTRTSQRPMGKKTNLLGLLPETSLFNVAGFLNPTDVHLLNELFPEVTQPLAGILSGRNFLTLDDPECCRVYEAHEH